MAEQEISPAPPAPRRALYFLVPRGKKKYYNYCTPARHYPVMPLIVQLLVAVLLLLLLVVLTLLLVVRNPYPYRVPPLLR